ncbi:hypothetical protein [Actinoplanes utahensis]|uniref:hypothetical protein n=1 Tax=Actinoplanes utahensis TaxID=1869 RepID=UPI00068A13F6|nr:hypothetical protein [Actinoplanes utahensis]GIF35585.1 hypothetical protein Aut01nite_85710 [Actinoplanes utahensis]
MRVISRKKEHGVEVYDAAMTLVRTFPVPPRSTYREPGSEGHVVTRSLDRLIYATDRAVLRVDPGGHEEWRFDLGERGPKGGVAYTDVALSDDETLVWAYLPNVMADRGRGDEWIVLDAATGELRARHELPTVGHSGDHFPLSGGRMLLEVGEGQDGIRIYLAGADGAPLDFGWNDRSLISVAPDESRFMTVAHDQEDLRIHELPGGEVRLRLTVADFGFDPEDEVYVEWSGGYLDGDSLVVVVTGLNQEGEEEWWRHFRVDARSGEVLGEMNITTIDQYDLTPLGDGTFLITDTDGTLRRM